MDIKRLKCFNMEHVCASLHRDQLTRCPVSCPLWSDAWQRGGREVQTAGCTVRWRCQLAVRTAHCKYCPGHSPPAVEPGTWKKIKVLIWKCCSFVVLLYFETKSLQIKMSPFHTWGSAETLSRETRVVQWFRKVVSCYEKQASGFCNCKFHAQLQRIIRRKLTTKKTQDHGII